MMFQLHFLPAVPRLRRRNAPLGLHWLAEVGGGLSRLPMRVLVALALLPACLLLASCPASRAGVSGPWRHRVEVPAAVVAKFFLVEAHIAGAGPYRFLVDTGSTLSLVSPAVAERSGARAIVGQAVEVHSSRGDSVALPAVELSSLEIGGARFGRVSAAVHDFSELSAQLGLPVHGLIGFPVFRDVVLTLDYPGRRLVISPAGETGGAMEGQLLALEPGQARPFVPIRVGSTATRALIDSGSDAAVSLNLESAPQPFVGPLRGTSLNVSISGEFPQVLGRLASDVHLGAHALSQPIVEVTRGESALGGGVLQHFSLTFDQRRGVLAVKRAGTEPIVMSSRRGTGVVFHRAADRWLVAAVLPASPAATAAVAAGDVCLRINGRPTIEWPVERFEALLRESDSVTFTLAAVTGERDVRIPVTALVQ